MKKLTEEEERARVSAMCEIENERLKKGYKYIAGVDEAGRGPLAGPVYAAAVILPEGMLIEGINDSKKLSEKKREELFDVICEKASAYCIAEVSHTRIDEINIRPDYVLIDGNRIKGMEIPHETVVKGDAKSISIAAASILAKVSRDRVMYEMAKQYPLYGFDKHKGYGTKAHCDAILKYGACEIHRRSFLKKILGEKA